jgi:hypothetical protein
VEAEARMAEIRGSGTWGSELTADEFAVIRSVGFEPVGQVLGAAVYNIGYTGGYNCPGPFGDGMVSPDRMVTQVSGRGGQGARRHVPGQSGGMWQWTVREGPPTRRAGPGP